MANQVLSKSDIGQRAEQLYNRTLKANLEPEHVGRVVAIDLDSGDYEVADSILSATKPLRLRRPHGEVFALRIGFDAMYALTGARIRRTS